MFLILCMCSKINIQSSFHNAILNFSLKRNEVKMNPKWKNTLFQLYKDKYFVSYYNLKKHTLISQLSKINLPIPMFNNQTFSSNIFASKVNEQYISLFISLQIQFTSSQGFISVRSIGNRDSNFREIRSRVTVCML